MRSTAKRRPAIAFCALLLGCLDLAHTNPFDPEAKVDVQVSGPDSAFSMQQVVAYTYTSNPEWPGVVEWRTGNDALLQSIGDGRYAVVGAATPPNDTASVIALLGTHVGTHRVVIRQRLTGLALSCVPASSRCVFPVGTSNAAVVLTGHDANGFGMVVPFSVQVVSSQPSVLRIDGGASGSAVSFTVAVTPLARGTSYVVASSSGVRDSILVTVP